MRQYIATELGLAERLEVFVPPSEWGRPSGFGGPVFERRAASRFLSAQSVQRATMPCAVLGMAAIYGSRCVAAVGARIAPHLDGSRHEG